MWYRARTLSLSLVAAALAVSCEPLTLSPLAITADLQAGVWGGPGVGVEVSDGSARVTLDCAFGKTTGPLVVDDEGTFEFLGWMVFEQGGPSDNAVQYSVRYNGVLRGDSIEFSIMPLQRIAFTPRTYVAIKGAEPTFAHCY